MLLLGLRKRRRWEDFVDRLWVLAVRRRGGTKQRGRGIFKRVVQRNQRAEVFIVRGDEPLLGPREGDFGVDNVGGGCLAVAIAVPHQAQVLDRLDDGRPIPLDAAMGGRRRDVGNRHLKCHFIKDCPRIGERLLNLGVRRAQ